jgi:protein TIF31
VLSLHLCAFHHSALTQICNGDEAYKKSVSRDVQNQRTIRALDIDGVGLILSAIIDYKGQRIIGQSILPGIFAQVQEYASRL